MSRIVNTVKLKNIRENYPDTWSWMKSKANWEQMCMGAVLENYQDYIEELKLKEYHIK